MFEKVRYAGFVRVMENLSGKLWNLSISVSRPGKSWKIIVYVVRKLLEVSKQGQNKIQVIYCRKYPKKRMILTNFDSGS